MNALNPSIKHHLLIGLFIGFWIFVFTFYIKPFDTGIAYFDWNKISIGFSCIAFMCYAVITILQKTVYNKLSRWTIGLEISTIMLFHLFNLLAAYTYYKSSFFNGSYGFLDFSNLFFQSALIFTPILILARIYVVRLKPIEEDTIIIKGENKLDLLKINKSDLVCISNSQNYVEIFFIENERLNSKLIRSSLKKMREELDFLIQVHRSHLINPTHFRSWKNANMLELTHIEIPVSKTFEKNSLPY